MRFVHIADVHLGTGFKTASFGPKKGKERRLEIKETLMRTVTYCEDNGVDLLLIAGDFFEEQQVTISELKDVNSVFGKLSKTIVLLSAGNHDPRTDLGSLYDLIDWVPQVRLFGKELTSIHFPELETRVWSFSWHQKHLPPFVFQEPVELDSNSTNILMLHGDVYQDSDYLYIDRGLLQGMGFDYVALGHIHKKDFIEPWLAYPGSLEPLDFSETGTHGFIEGTIVGHHLVTDFKPFSRRSFHRVPVMVDGQMTFETIIDIAFEAVRGMSPDDFYRIILEGDLATDVELDLETLVSRLEKQLYYVEVVDRTQLDLNLEQLEMDYEGTLIGAYITAMKEKDTTDPIVADAMKKGIRLLLEEQVKL